LVSWWFSGRLRVLISGRTVIMTGQRGCGKLVRAWFKF
jgi:hypothetical protein